MGPARILATEKHREVDGGLTPGSSVWLVRGRNLLKCCPEQLRRASEREELVEALSTPENATPCLDIPACCPRDRRKSIQGYLPGATKPRGVVSCPRSSRRDSCSTASIETEEASTGLGGAHSHGGPRSASGPVGLQFACSEETTCRTQSVREWRGLVGDYPRG